MVQPEERRFPDDDEEEMVQQAQSDLIGPRLTTWPTQVVNERRQQNRAAATAAGVRLVEIIPSEDIGGAFDGWQGVFDASPEMARHLIDLGRKDACKARKAAGLAQ